METKDAGIYTLLVSGSAYKNSYGLLISLDS